MSAVTHIAGADLRRFSWPIAVWVLLTIASTMLEGVAPRGEVRGWDATLLILGAGLLWWARLLIGVSLIVMIVQAHGLVGTTAFWLTRPVSRQKLLLAKLLLIASILILVPAVCEVVVMIIYRVPAADMLAVVTEWALIRACLVGIVMLFASLTRNFSHFVLALGVTSASLGLVIMAAMVFAHSRTRPVGLVALSGDTASMIESRFGDQSGSVIGMVLAVALLFIALRTQYQTRIRRRVVAIAVAGSVGVLAVSELWPWPLLHAERRTPDWAASDDVHLEAPAQSIWFQTGPWNLARESRWQVATGTMFVKGLAPGWSATAYLRHGTLHYDGRQVTSELAWGGGTLASSAGLPNSKRVALQQALDVDVIAEQWHPGPPSVPVLVVRTDEAPHTRTRGHYEGVFRIDLDHTAVAGVLPLGEGATFQENDYRLVVRRIESRESGPLLVATISRALSVFGRQARPGYAVYLRNPRTREGVGGRMLELHPPLRFPGMLPLRSHGGLGIHTGFFAEAFEVRFASTYDGRLPSAASPTTGIGWNDSEWLSSAELVVIKTTPAGSITRSVVIKEVAVNGGANITKAP